jgi:hypothetical protein
VKETKKEMKNACEKNKLTILGRKKVRAEKN